MQEAPSETVPDRPTEPALEAEIFTEGNPAGAYTASESPAWLG
jgi:hypothetical protein